MAEEELEDLQPAGLRPFWTGTITFGLVTVPVSLFSATRPRGTALRMVGPDQSPVRRRYVCSKDGQPLEADDIVRGYEIEKGKFVVVTDAELESLEPRKSREIDLRVFVDRDDIDPVLFDRSYFLAPAGGTNKAYRLLAEVMEREKQAGIATFVMRAKEVFVAILAENGILRAETLRFGDEIRSAGEVGLPEPVKPAAADVKRFEAQIAKHARRLDLSDFLDDYAEALEKLVKAKEKKGAGVVKAKEPERDQGEDAEVIDLLAALNRSLGGVKPVARKAARKASTASSKKSGGKPGKKTASRKPARRKTASRKSA